MDFVTSCKYNTDNKIRSWYISILMWKPKKLKENIPTDITENSGNKSSGKTHHIQPNCGKLYIQSKLFWDTTNDLLPGLQITGSKFKTSQFLLYIHESWLVNWITVTVIIILLESTWCIIRRNIIKLITYSSNWHIDNLAWN